MMIKIKSAMAITTIFIIGFTLPAFAKPDISMVLNVNKVVESKGKQTLGDAKKAFPGDVILYTLKIVNKGNSAAINLQPTGEIPSNTIYLPEKNSSKDYKILFSIDKGKTYNENPTIKINENGKLITKPAPIEMYNRIKWIFSDKFESKKNLDLTYKVKVK